MNKQIEAIYEKGMLRLLEPLPFKEHQRGYVIVTAKGSATLERSHEDTDYLELVRKRVSAMERIPTVQEVQEITAKDPSSWADAIITQRGNRI